MLTIILSLFYSFTIFLFAFAWKAILECFNETKLHFKYVMFLYVKANISKYLPGNFMHYVSRNILGHKLGWKHSDIILSSLVEIGISLVTALVLALALSYTDFLDILVDILGQLFKNVGWIQIISVLLLIAAALSILAAVLYKKGLLESIRVFFNKKFLAVFAKVFIINSFNFFVLGCMLVIILISIIGLDPAEISYFKVISAYILAWIAGFVIPGSPGGIGVRESVLILMLSPQYGTDNILLASLIHRLISIFGDIIAFGADVLIGRKDNILYRGGAQGETDNSNTVLQ